MATGDESRIGIICRPDHHVFETVGRRLVDRGHEVTYFEPGRELPPSAIAELSLLVCKKVRPASIQALRLAERAGIATWNGRLPTTILASRLVMLKALSAVGFRAPPVTFEPPDSPYVSKPLFCWDGDPEIGGTGGFYQPLLDTDGRDRKCYIVDDGQQLHTATVICSSKLFGERQILGHEPTPERYVDRMGRLLTLMDTEVLGVDIIEADDTRYAIDCNAAPSFREAGLESALTDSIHRAVPNAD
ncbi:ATP-grasp domain-containing protein [Halapricum hydrolyticum]|uniref:Histidine kinase n=1 Tax=Halapricum hydrolyticum TaxID=2979991 RepID=A0AAE3IEY2_9EURY|nr:histidine kinase [Halapricum hydrolyticum]MCU4719452.1 histidine kinase [Halapricum hydrolyticum]MCU4728063.1 histidine kinase [Halapricum hydrolyticum]